MTRLPDESTILRFRPLPETHGLAARMLALGAAGLMRAEKDHGNDAHD